MSPTVTRAPHSGWLAERLSGLGLAYLHVIDPRIKGDTTLHEGRGAVAAAFMRQHYTGTIIAAGGFDRVQAIRSSSAETRTMSPSLDGSPPIPICRIDCAMTGP